ncbi:hypothetical protein FA95DRAFT_1604651 [Auriscalpium vulgare]|uniref:Uncharacterized protein n=1 Tax=Auriscalpium vulgare TaxID=40419 RepID=A0ACB8RXW5_9AGAM|nr:hypothetical protein FA95DRAFT_1604651 [Auriscalpium vulgare]
MSPLPIELLSEIASGVASEEDLRQLRAVSKAFKNIASADAFRKITVSPSVKSARGLLNILDSPELVMHVREIEFVEEAFRMAGQSEGSGDARGPGASEEGGGAQGEAVAEGTASAKEILAEAYALLHQAPTLHTLSFKFRSMFLEEDAWDDDSHKPSDSLLLHWAILGAIANNPHPLPNLRTLTLDKLLQFRNDLFDTPHFAAIVGALHHLHLDVLADDNDGSYYQDPLQNFWDQAQERFLRPAVELRSLHLDSNIEIGMMPAVDFARLTYPHLEAVFLRNVLFNGLEPEPVADSAEEFLARHGQTLKKLELFQCTMYYEEEDAPVRFWEMVWRRYAQALEVLSELVVQFDHEGQREMRYSWLSAGHSYMPDTHAPGEEEDNEAFGLLKALVDARK